MTKNKKARVERALVRLEKQLASGKPTIERQKGIIKEINNIKDKLSGKNEWR